MLSFLRKKENPTAVPASKIIPYSRHVDEFTVKTKNGSFVRTWEVTGVNFQMMSENELIAWHEAKQLTFKSIAHTRIAIWTNLIRDEFTERLNPKYENLFCQNLFNEYNKKVLKETFSNRYFISLIVKGDDALEELRNKLDQGGKLSDEVMLRFLNQRAKIIEIDFQGAGIKPLRLVETEYGVKSEFASFIGKLYNGKYEDQPVTLSSMSDSIPNVATLFHKEVISQRGTSETTHGAILTVKNYAKKLNINQFNDFLGLPFPFTLSQSFTYCSQGKTDFTIERIAKELKAVSKNGSDEYDELEELRSEISAGKIVLGAAHITFYTYDKNIEIAANNLDIAEGIMRKGAVIATRDTLSAESSWLSGMPGNHRKITYAPPLSNRDFSIFNSFHNHGRGKKENNHWGPAVLQCMTKDKTPYYFNWHVADVGHTGIYGETGSGKTVVENLLILASQQFNPQGAIFDSKRNAEVLIKVLNGHYFNFNPGTPTGAAPMQMEPTQENIEFNKDLIEMMVQLVGPKLNIQELNEINDAVESVMSDRLPLNGRSITALLSFFPDTGSESLHERIAIWCKGNKLGWLFDNEEDKIKLDTNMVGFNTDQILKMGLAQSPLMAYLFHRVEQKKTGRPYIIVFAEFHQILEHPYFVKIVREGIKKDRDKNTMYIYDTQSISDAVESNIGTAVREQTATNIFLANPKGKYKDYEKLGVSEEEFEFIKKSTKDSRKIMVKQEGKADILDMNLYGIKKYLPILSANKNTINIFDRIVSKYGESWLSHFIKEANNA